mgnify:FL=1
MSEVEIYDQETGARIGSMTDAQFKVLTTYLRLAGEDVGNERDHRITRVMLDIMRRESQRVGAEAHNLPELGQPERGARAEMRAARLIEVTDLLRSALGKRTEMTIYWQKD